MIVAGLQPDIAWEDPLENFSRATALADRAAAEGARLLVLPEAFATGFSMRSEAMATHAGAVTSFMSELARRLDVWVLGGFVEVGRDRPVNACSLVAPDGHERLHSRKVHPFSLAGEADRYEAGNTVSTTLVEGVRVTPIICYDLRFVELFRPTAEATDCYVVIANWPSKRAHAWRTLLAARAIDCQAFVLGVNRVGDAQGYPHRGDTTLLDPMGETMATLADRPGIVTGEIDPAIVVQTRKHYPFLTDRRPEIYNKV